MLTYPDHGAYQSSVISPEGDLGEIIARLGGPRFRREGRILSFADCSPGLDGWDLSAGTGYVSYGSSFVGSAKVTFFGLGSSTISKHIPNTQSLRMGIDIMVNPRNSNNITFMQIIFYLGTILRWAQISVNHASGLIQYLDGTGAITTLTTTPLVADVDTWINLKMVADGDLGQYVRFIANNTEFPMSQSLLQVNSNKYGTTFEITATRINPVIDTNIELDAMLITTNER